MSKSMTMVVVMTDGSHQHSVWTGTDVTNEDNAIRRARSWMGQVLRSAKRNKTALPVRAVLLLGAHETFTYNSAEIEELAL